MGESFNITRRVPEDVDEIVNLSVHFPPEDWGHYNRLQVVCLGQQDGLVVLVAPYWTQRMCQAVLCGWVPVLAATDRSH